MTDKELLESIKSHDVNRSNKAIKYLYQDEKIRHAIFSYVDSHNDDKISPEDIFQDSLVLLFRNIREGKFQEDSTIRTYLIGIAKWQFLSYKRKNKKELLDVGLRSQTSELYSESKEASLIAKESRQQLNELINKLLNELPEPCRKLLKLRFQGYSHLEISEIMRYTHAGVSRTKYASCLKKIRELVEKDEQLMSKLKIKS